MPRRKAFLENEPTQKQPPQKKPAMFAFTPGSGLPWKPSQKFGRNFFSLVEECQEWQICKVEAEVPFGKWTPPFGCVQLVCRGVSKCKWPLRWSCSWAPTFAPQTKRKVPSTETHTHTPNTVFWTLGILDMGESSCWGCWHMCFVMCKTMAVVFPGLSCNTSRMGLFHWRL